MVNKKLKRYKHIIYYKCSDCGDMVEKIYQSVEDGRALCGSCMDDECMEPYDEDE